MQWVFVGWFRLLFSQGFIYASWIWLLPIFMVIWIKIYTWRYLKNFANLCNLENFTIHRSSYLSHPMDLNKPIICDINISLNIIFLMDLRMMILDLAYLVSIISRNLSSSLLYWWAQYFWSIQCYWRCYCYVESPI